MNNLLSYKDFYGSAEYSSDDNVFYGKIIGITDRITYEGESVTELKKNFEEAVIDYLQLCKEVGKSPEKSYKGSFNVRISPSLHKKLAMYAAAHNSTLNSTVENAIRNYVSQL